MRKISDIGIRRRCEGTTLPYVPLPWRIAGRCRKMGVFWGAEAEDAVREN